MKQARSRAVKRLRAAYHTIFQGLTCGDPGLEGGYAKSQALVKDYASSF